MYITNDTVSIIKSKHTYTMLFHIEVLHKYYGDLHVGLVTPFSFVYQGSTNILIIKLDFGSMIVCIEH